MIIIGLHSLESSITLSSRFEEPKVLKAISSQTVPRFVYEEYPKFVEFIESFMDFIELKYDVRTDEFRPGPYYILKNLISTVDIDKTSTEYLQFFKRTYARDFPNVTEQEIRSFLKKIKNFYLRKGTVDSFDFFFRSVFASFSEIYLPKVDMLRASDGKWYVEYQIRLKRMDGDLSYLTPTELTQVFDSSIRGQSSNATAWVGSPVQALIIGSVDPNSYYWLPVLSRKGEFTPGETVTLTLPDGTSKDFWIGLTDSLQVQPGRWLTSDGFLSSDKKIQDSFYWQDFSYVIKTDSAISEFMNPMINCIHPAGFRIFSSIQTLIPNIIEVYPDNFNFLAYRELVIWLRNWDLVTGAPEIAEISGMSAAHLNMKIVDSGEGQGFLDWGTFHRLKESDDYSNLFRSISAIDDVEALFFEAGDPNASLLVTIAGRKILSSDEEFSGSNTNWKEVRVVRSDSGEYQIDADSLPISELSDESLFSLERLSSQVFRNSGTAIAHHQVNSSEITQESVIVEDLDLIPGGKYLVFVDGRKVQSDLVSIEDYVDAAGNTRNRLFVPHPNQFDPIYPVIEVIPLASRALRSVPYIQAFHGTVDGNSLALIREFTFSDFAPNIELGTRSPWDFLVFRGEKHLRPAIDYFISEDGSGIKLRGLGLYQGEIMEIYFLKSNQTSHAYPLTASGISAVHCSPKPPEIMFDRAPGRLYCPQVERECSIWINFDASEYDSVLDSFLNTVDGSGLLLGYFVATTRNGELETGTAPDGSDSWRFGDGDIEALYSDSTLNASISDLNNAGSGPFSFSLRYKAGTGFAGGELLRIYGSGNLSMKITLIPNDPDSHYAEIFSDGISGSVLLNLLDIPNDEFVTIGFSYDGTNIEGYLNGTMTDSNTIAQIYPFDGSENLFVGSAEDGSSVCTNLQIELFAAWNERLTPIEHKSIHNGGRGLPAPLSYF